MFHDVKPYERPLSNGLILKSISSEDEVERLAKFNVAMHGDEMLERMTRSLVMKHPSTHPQEWLIVEDPSDGKIVSSLCLLPWKIRYGTVTLKGGEMGIVATLPDYRRQGLIRALNERFTELLNEGGYHLSHIQGIPYYYRQFDYEYILPLEGGWGLQHHNIPEKPIVTQWEIVKASSADIPQLSRLYEQSMSRLDIASLRDEAIWRYLLEEEDSLSGGQETFLVQDENKVIQCYFRVAKEGFGEGLIVDEASNMSPDMMIQVLQWLKKLAIERGKPSIRLAMSDDAPLVKFARGWGAKLEWRYAWQIMLPDPARLLSAIAPVLEQRIADSIFDGLSETVTINLYRRAYQIVFDKGLITAVQSPGFYEGASTISMPPTLLASLILGYKNRETLQSIYPDVTVRGDSQYLIDTLFPEMKSFLHIIY